MTTSSFLKHILSPLDCVTFIISGFKFWSEFWSRDICICCVVGNFPTCISCGGFATEGIIFRSGGRNNNRPSLLDMVWLHQVFACAFVNTPSTISNYALRPHRHGNDHMCSHLSTCCATQITLQGYMMLSNGRGDGTLSRLPAGVCCPRCSSVWPPRLRFYATWRLSDRWTFRPLSRQLPVPPPQTRGCRLHQVSRLWIWI